MKNISYIDTRSRIRYNCTVSSPAARHRLFLGLFIGKHLPPLPSSPHTHTHRNLGAYLCPGGSPDPPTAVVRCHFDFRSTCATRRRCFHLAVCILQMHLYVSVRLSAAASVSVTVYTCNYNALLKATTIAQACKQADTQTDRQTYREGQTKIQWDRQTYREN